MKGKALVVGASGIIGRALSETLLQKDWTVYGLSRGHTPLVDGCIPVTVDLNSAEDVSSVLKDKDVTHAFLTTWSRQATEAENIRVNGQMVSNVLNAVGDRIQHASLVTGLKHYLGPFEDYANGKTPPTPFREEQGRQPVSNFYYAQEDSLFAAAEQFGFNWSVHRPHTVIGYAVGNAMNMGQTLAVYATLCRETGQPFIFPGSETQWHCLTDMTDAHQLAKQVMWAATSEAGKNNDFNIVNGDIFRWQWMWHQIADYFGIKAEPFDGIHRPLESRMQQASELWLTIADKYQLKERDLSRLASWWHTDADLGRPMEVVTDMSKSRKAGFLDYQCTLDAFICLFEQLQAEKIIPKVK